MNFIPSMHHNDELQLTDSELDRLKSGEVLRMGALVIKRVPEEKKEEKLSLWRRLMRKIFKPSWEISWACVNCRKELTHSEVFDSLGVCPHCGAVTEGTIVAADKIARLR